MTPEGILAALRTAAPGNVLNLPGTAFGPGSFSLLLSTYFADGRMKASLTSLDIDAPNNRVVALGTGTAAPLDATTFTAYFCDDGRGVQMTLSATPTQVWQFSSSFPAFAQSFADSLSWKSFTLTLDSTKPVAEALWLDTELDMSGPYSWLFGRVATLSLAGAVAIENGVPTFALEHEIEQHFSVGTLQDIKLGFAFRATAVSAQVAPVGGGAPSTQWGAVATIGCYGTAPLGKATANLSIDLAITNAALIARLEVDGPIGLDDFAGLVHEAPLGAQLPPKSLYDPGSTFASATIAVTIDPRQCTIAAISLTLRATPHWPLFERTELRDIYFELQVADPLGSRSVTAALGGTIAWPDGILRVGGSTPPVTLFAVLSDGSKIPLGEVLDRTLPTAVPATLVVDEFALQIRPPQQPAQGLAFDLSTGISGDWPIKLGPVAATLKGAWMELSRADGATTGTIAATATLGALMIDGSWAIPGTFRLEGQLNGARSLSDLVSTLKLRAAPDHVPDILITAAAAGIVIAPDSGKTTTYTFYATASAATASTALGTVWFAMRSDVQGVGFLAGFVVPATWSPGDLLPALKPLFDSLQFSDTGLIVSSIQAEHIDIPILKQASLPSSIAPGALVFTSLSLKGGGLDLLSKLFSRSILLDLSAQLDFSTPLNSSIHARLRAAEMHGSLQFAELGIDIAPGAETFRVSASAIVSIGKENVTVRGDGTVTMTPTPAATLSLSVEQWANPFDIHGLTIQSFGIGFTFSETVAIGFLGHFLIGAAPRQFKFTIGGGLLDFEAPSAILFGLDATGHQTLMLGDLTAAFTHLDARQVPVLRDIGFRHLDFTIVDDPNGFTIGHEHFPPGIRITADVTLSEWDLDLDLAINTGRGVYAKGALDKPIVVGSNVLVIASADGKKGPSILIDTAAFAGGEALVDRERSRLSALHFEPPVALAASPNASAPTRAAAPAPTYLQMDAAVSLLSTLSETITISVSRDTFDFSYAFEFFGVKEALTCFLSAQQKKLTATAKFAFALDVKLPAVVIEGVTVFPGVSLHAPKATLDLGLSIGWARSVQGSFRLTVHFDWRTFHLDFTAEITLAEIANALEKLGQALLAWMDKNVHAVWNKILSDFDTFVRALRSGAVQLADGAYGVAMAMITLFGSSIAVVTDALWSLGFSLEAITEAIARAFGIGLEEAKTYASAQR
jgi:hypothetical protein